MLASPRLRRIASEAGAPARPESEEHCDMCGEPLPEPHRHLVDLGSQTLLCACRACTLLFDRRAAGGGHLRLVPDRRLVLDGFELTAAAWEELRIPVDMAFFFRSSRAGRVMAFYPGPMGATESRLELSSWNQLQDANPVLKTMEPDVEALLVDRARGSSRQWLVPIDDCYRLVGLIRTTWRGLSGGKEVWLRIESFLDDLDRKGMPWQSSSSASRR